MQTNYRSSQPGRMLGLPSSPACTRLGRDAAEAPLQTKTQLIVFPPVRPLRPRKSIVSESESFPTGTARTLSEFRSMGHPLPPRSKVVATHQSSTLPTSESSVSSNSSRGTMSGAQLSQRSSITSLENELEESRVDSLQTEAPLSLRLCEVPNLQNGYFSLSGDNDSIWNRVAAAANTLKVTVNKAWALTINTSEQEETSGCDSHLIRVMKAYHLAKASHPADLPDWLFDECERKPFIDYRFTQSPSGAVSDIQPLPTLVGYIHNEAVSRAHQLSPSVSRRPPSKAADRLKIFRNAKRADFGLRYASPKSEGLSYSPSRTQNTRHGAGDRGGRTRQPLQPAQQLRPGAF